MASTRPSNGLTGRVPHSEGYDRDRKPPAEETVDIGTRPRASWKSPAAAHVELPMPIGAVKLLIHTLIQTNGDAGAAAELLRRRADPDEAPRTELLANLLEDAT